MPKLSSIVYYAFHPQQLRSMIQWKVWHDPVHQRIPEKEDPTLRECFIHLNNTSRSFSAVIQELHPELLVPVCLFYLVLRGLDTIEDDMTIDVEKKDPLLRDFQNILEKDGWTFTESGPDEKDRDLLVHFDCVIAEFKKIKQPYRVIIKDITKRMGNGMADYVRNAKFNTYGVESVKDYELYCHYVAGLVGEGLTRLFVESGLANPGLLSRPQLMESMGQFLQQVNIIRDIREDFEDKRRFWPREIWSKHVDEFEDLFKPENKEKAMGCQSEMVLHALQRADECLFYLAGIREQSVFNFCAIPQSMAIATLELCFRNYQMFERNIKITKGDTCRLMIDSTQNLQIICGVFKTYARKIQKKNNPVDPNYLEIGIACGKIEQFIESVFPTSRPDSTKASALTVADQKKKDEADAEAKKDAMYMLFAVIVTLGVISAFMIGAAWLAGARFDLVIAQLRNGTFRPQTTDTVTHGEL